MSDRDEDVAKLAKAMGRKYLDVPAPDAQIHEHMEFVGRIAEALGPDWHLELADIRGTTKSRAGGGQWMVGFRHSAFDTIEGWNTAQDPAHAAVRAATSAKNKESRTRAASGGVA